ncbi:MAG: patatin-like phospholipase family protein, partial [Gammaproteobacteria bacterium]
MDGKKLTGKRQAVSLVLGSGGARGLAHIGVITWLEKHGFEIQSISGCSMGALIGGIYAAGQLDAYSTWVRALEKMDVIRLLDISFRRHSLFKGERIIDTLKELIGDHTIDELPISYTAVATDLHNQKEIWIRHGPLFDAIRASIAIPTIFSPHHYMGKLLFDGSLVNPVPIAPTLNDKTDITIAVNLNGAAQTEPMITEIPPEQPSDKKKKYHQRIVEFVAGMGSK